MIKENRVEKKDNSHLIGMSFQIAQILAVPPGSHGLSPQLTQVTRILEKIKGVTGELNKNTLTWIRGKDTGTGKSPLGTIAKGTLE